MVDDDNDPHANPEGGPAVKLNLPVSLRARGREFGRTVIEGGDDWVFVESPDGLTVGDPVHISLGLPGGAPLVVLATVHKSLTPGEAALFDLIPGMELYFPLLDGATADRWLQYVEQARTGMLPTQPQPKARTTKPEIALKEGRRAAPRRDARFRVRLRDEGALHDFYTRNISRGGMFLVTNKLLPTGSKLELLVVHPVTGKEFALDARVRWTSAEGVQEDQGMGVALVPRSSGQEEEFLSFMNDG